MGRAARAIQKRFYARVTLLRFKLARSYRLKTASQMPNSARRPDLAIVSGALDLSR